MRRVHWKRFLLIAVVLLLAAGAAYALNGLQVKRQALTFRTRAEKAAAEAKADPAKRAQAIALYEEYLKFRPKDEEAYTQYIRMRLDDAEAEPVRRTAVINSTVAFLTQFPDHPDERRRLISLYMKTGSLNGARENIHLLLQDKDGRFANDLDLLDKMATVEERERKYPEAFRFVERGIETGKVIGPKTDVAQLVKFYNHALILLRVMRKETEAAILLETLLKKPPYATRPDARVAVGRYLLARGEYAPAREHVAEARQLPGGDKSADVFLASAEVELAGRESHMDAARGYLETAFDLDPKNVAIGALLAEVLSKQGQKDKAVAALRKTADALPSVKEEFYAVLDKLIDLREVPTSERLLERLNEENTPKYFIQYFRGRLFLVKDDWPAAKHELEACAPVFATTPQFHKKIQADLGRCYDLSHNPDQMLKAYAAARKDDGDYYPARLGEAQALVKLGQIKKAIPLYQELAREDKAFQFTLAKLMFLELMGQQPDTRDWRAFDQAVGLPPYSTELLLLKADGLSARELHDQAKMVLEEAVKQDPKNPAVALKALRIGPPGLANRQEILDKIKQAVKDSADSVEFRLASASVLLSHPRKPSVAELRAIGEEKAEPPFSTRDQYRLWFGLGEAALRLPPEAGMREAALEFFRRAAAIEPRDLLVRAVLIDVGLTLDRKDVWETALREIAAAEGPDGPISNIGQIAVRLKTYAPGDRETLRELRAKAEAAQKKRSGWSRTYLALAQIDELEGLNDAALKHLQEAIKLGEKQVGVIRKAVELMRERKMYESAAVLLNEMHAQVTLPDDLQRFRAIMNLLTHDSLTQDLQEINRFAPADAPTYEMQLLRGTLLSAIREDAGAEQAFRKALEKVPSERPNAAPLEAWTALVAHLVRVGKTDDAKRAVAEAERKLRTDPPKTENLAALANCHEVVGDFAAAEKAYRLVVVTAPAELNGQRQLVFFFQRTGRTQEAEAMLQALAHNPGQDIARWARRHLAVSLMMRPDAYQQRQAARALVDKNLQDAANDPEDRKALAIVLATDPATRGEGMKILSEFAAQVELTPDEFYYLGRLYFEQGKFDDALRYFKYAVRERPNISVEHLAGIIRLHLAMNGLRDAEAAAVRLKRIAPRSWEATREEARVLHRTQRTEQAKAGILAFPGAQDGDAIPSLSGPLLEEIGCYDEAERLYRKYLETSPSPTAHVPLAIFYVNRKQPEKAIELAQKYESRTPVVLTARLLSGAVRAKLPAADVVANVVDWMSRKMAENERKPDVYPFLVGALAELKDARGLFDEAIAEYRRALTLTQSDLLTNNLAMLLALHRPKEAEAARAMMDAVIGLRGPVPTFLDTRAVTSLIRGENATADAVKDLKLALAQQQRAVYHFHLAWAYDLLRREADKQEELVRARQMGLTTDDLHPKELKKYQELFAK